MISNAIHGYRKSRIGVGSTYTAKLTQDKKYLCVNYIAKDGLKQWWLRDLTRRWAR